MKRTISVVFAAFCGAACGGGASGTQLAAAPGQSRAQIAELMNQSDYCSASEGEPLLHRYERCDRPGMEVESSWAEVEFDSEDRASRLSRFERWPDAKSAGERWNKLVEQNSESFGAPSDDARARLAELGETPEGALRWAAWFGRSGEVVVGVYIAQAEGEEQTIKEIIRYSASVED